jgi:hypothetical protein
MRLNKVTQIPLILEKLTKAEAITTLIEYGKRDPSKWNTGGIISSPDIDSGRVGIAATEPRLPGNGTVL